MSKKTVFFDAYCGYVMASVVENGKITEFNFEKKDSVSIVGNIYKGRVESVLPGMNAAFVNCGLERNCYLSADDAYPDAGKYEGNNAETAELCELKEGDEIAVQVLKAPVGKKGARVTAFPSFVGKHLIYMPKTPFVGVSRKIADEELRKNLIYSAGKMIGEGEGLILRTAAPYAKRKQLELELSYLRNMYAGIENSFATAKTGDLLYADVSLPVRVMRDTLSFNIEKIIVGSSAMEKLIKDLANLYPAENRFPVELRDTGRDLMYEYGLTEQINELVSPQVQLENGAYLVIEKTEALTVVDVNTGKFTGDDSLEQTVYHTNILAAREIARQVKLRNVGGIVVVDFIDMVNPTHRNALVDELERSLKKDSAKCTVSPMSQFGLVEFTRKRTGVNPLSLMLRPCRNCKTGSVKSPKFILLNMRVKLLNMYADGERRIKLDMNSELLTEFTEWQEIIADLKTRMPEAEIYGAPHRSYSDEHVVYSCGENFTLAPNCIKII